MTTDFRSGVAIVTTDINGDTYDDLVRFNDGTLLEVSLQGHNGRYYKSYSTQLNSDGQWNAIAGDVNNDGWVDIVASGAYDKVKVYYANPFESHFSRDILEGDNFFAQGSNIVDINNDGWSDIFVCNDNGTNVVYLNDSTGAFKLAPDLIDFNSVPASDNSGNYGSIWNDFDSDGDLDLFIAKCRQGVFDPTDPRRINVLFVNTDSGFYEMADTFGLANGAQSWSPDFADIDNDGDLDLFITNHDLPSQLYENIDNKRFEDITDSSGIVVLGLAIQSVFHDFNNDGLVDLFIGGTTSAIYQNLGNHLFAPVFDPFGGKNVTSFGLSDINGDGFTDIYAAYHELFNSPSDVIDDEIWINDGNDNNFIRIHLRGTTCNASAIGARVEIFGEWGIQMQEVRAGESYGITNSLIKNFGLGQSTVVDSLAIIWPNGVREVHVSPPVNTTLTATEGGCLMAVVDLDQGPFTQCGSDTFDLSAPDGYIGYLWSNGMVSKEISVTEPGIYHVTLTDANGCSAIGALIEVLADDLMSETEIDVAGATQLCYGDEVLLTAPPGNAYMWNTGDTTEVIAAQNSGEYRVTVTRNCGQIEIEPVALEFSDPNQFEVMGDSILGSGSGTLTTNGDSVSWYDSMDGLIALGTGSEFNTPVVDTSTVFYAENISVIEGQSERVGMEDHDGGSMYNGDNFNGRIIFDVYATITLDSIKVITDFAGDRRIIVEDQNSNFIFDEIFNIDSGVHYLKLDLTIPPGTDYQIRTAGETNQATFGTNSPQLVRSDGGVLFPYVVEDVMAITTTSVSEDFYYYFYDWHITTSAKYCMSDRVAVEVVVTDSSTQVLDLALLDMVLYPNPTSGDVFLRTADHQFSGLAQYVVRSLDGRIITHGSVTESLQAIDVSQAPAGIYLIEITDGNTKGIGRFVKTE